MPTITDLVRVEWSAEPTDPEDIFASAPGLIFTDDLRNMHGDPGSTIIYKSQRFGDIRLQTADPQGEDERRLFSHYLWNAGIKMAELMSATDGSLGDARWSVTSRKVIELGAGVGLGGIVATLAGADEVVLTDYPAPVVLANIKSNAERNIPSQLRDKYSVLGHEWGDTESTLGATLSGRFNRVLAADCYWMPYQHVNLAKSMLHCLSTDPDARIFTISGFHTGRKNLATFFDVAVEEGLEIEEIYEEDAEGCRRPWKKERDGGAEDHTERKKWLVIALLRRRRSVQL